MPELPEVETVRRTLAPRLVGATLRRAELRLPRLLEVGTPEEVEALAGHQLVALERRGKYLLLRTARGDTPGPVLVVHLGMTGALTYRAQDQPVADRFVRLQSGYMKATGPHSVDRHTHLRLELEGGGEALFRDPRTFGRLLLLAPEGLDSTPRLARLGPDALDVPEELFLRRWRAAAGKRAVKAVLLDQGFLAGIGNIYADEACFGAGVRPQAVSGKLGRARVRRLAAHVQEALARGLANCGTSFSDFVDGEGNAGRNQEDLRVYDRGGEPCVRCERPLVKTVVAQRGTVFCPRCQR